MRSRQGFTLVELLVVIGIIALLISVLMPALARARESGKAIKCSSNLRQIGQAIQMYVNENRGQLPYGAVAMTASKMITWDDLLNRYLGGRMDPDQQVEAVPTQGVPNVLICPSDTFDPISWGVAGSRRTYALNQSYSSSNQRGPFGKANADLYPSAPLNGWNITPIATAPFKNYKIAQLRSITKLIFATEYPTVDNIAGHSGKAVINLPSDRNNTASGYNGYLYGLHWRLTMYNYLFGDGHCEALQLSDTFGANPVTHAPGTASLPYGMWTIDPAD